MQLIKSDDFISCIFKIVYPLHDTHIMKNTFIFDLDGTLLNTLEDLSNSVNYALAANQLPIRSTEDIRCALGNGIQVLIEKSVPQQTNPAIVEKVLTTFRAYYLKHSMDHTAPYDGIIDLLKILKQRKIHTAIVSNKLDPAVQELYQRFFSEYIDIAIGEQQPIVRRKPYPDMVNLALHKLETTTEEAIYIGDSEVDLQTATNTGIDCVSVSWGFRSRTFLEDLGATNIIDTPMQLLSRY